MDPDDFFVKQIRAFVAFVAFMRDSDIHVKATHFNKFLGMPARTNFFEFEELTKEAITKIEWLSGPHAKVLFRAWKIKYEGSQQGLRPSTATKGNQVLDGSRALR